MTCNQKLFSNLDIIVKSKIKLGDDHLVYVLEKGTISVIIIQNEIKDIPIVYFVLALKHNMLSVG